MWLWQRQWGRVHGSHSSGGQRQWTLASHTLCAGAQNGGHGYLPSSFARLKLVRATGMPRRQKTTDGVRSLQRAPHEGTGQYSLESGSSSWPWNNRATSMWFQLRRVMGTGLQPRRACPCGLHNAVEAELTGALGAQQNLTEDVCHWPGGQHTDNEDDSWLLRFWIC